MSESQNPTMASALAADKGKGKATEAEDVFMGQEPEDTDSEGSDVGDDDAVCVLSNCLGPERTIVLIRVCLL